MKQGFTLIEVLVVIALIGIAVAFIIPLLRNGNHTKDAEAFSISLAQYITDAGNAATNREQPTCVSRQDTQYVTSGITRNPLNIPDGVSTSIHDDICFNNSGRLSGPPVSITVSENSNEVAHVILTSGYGTAEVKP